MFGKSLDNKQTYMIDDNEVVDLSESIFDHNKAMTRFTSMYKVARDFEMRPDLISMALYGSTDYTEMILKYSLVNNPFSIERDDLIYGASYASIYNPIKDSMVETTGVFDAVKNYHKYIDKNKVPTKPGSDTNNIKIEETGIEANISKTGDTGITVKDGKVYFGNLDPAVTTVDSSIVQCAEDGTTLGEFLNATIRNNT